MAPQPITLILEREHLRRLINGNAVIFHAQAGPIEVRLDLDRSGPVGQWTDPPEARELHPKAFTRWGG